MYKIFYFIVLLLLGVSCQKEGHLTPSEGIENFFEVPEGATDAESVLRREFQKETGTYLLFNDTLRKEFLGTDRDGFPVYSFETVNLGYGVMSSSRNKFTFHYLSTLEIKENVADFVKNRVLPLMDKELYPYSLLLVDSVFQANFYLEEGADPSEGFYGSGKDFMTYYSGVRCLAISVGDIPEMNKQEERTFLSDLFKGMITSTLSVRASDMVDFYKSGEPYYGKKGYLGYGIDIDHLDDFRELGFLGGYMEEDYGDVYVEFQKKEEDIAAFVGALFEDENTFLKENESFPLVIEKYNIIKKLVRDLGYKLELLDK